MNRALSCLIPLILVAMNAGWFILLLSSLLFRPEADGKMRFREKALMVTSILLLVIWGMVYLSVPGRY